MKSKFSYKSKRTIIIAAIITVLLAGTATGVYFFTKGNAQAQAAGDNNTTQEQYGEAPEENKNEQQNNTTENEQNKNEQGETTPNQQEEQETERQEQTTNNNQTTQNEQTTTTTTGEVPNQEYVTEREETVKNPWESLEVGWGPTQFASIASTANLTAKKSNLEIHKTVDKESVKIGDTLTYTISVKNNGDKVAKAIIYDNVPEGTVLLNKDNNEDENTKKLTWRVTVEPGETEKVEFTVRVKAEKGTIKNSAIINGKTTNETETGIINITGKKEVNTSEAKVGDTLTYTITLTNSGNATGTVTVTDEIPAGTTLVEKSITNNGVESNGTITWTDVEVKAGDTVEVSFKVTINNDTKTSVRNTAVIDDNKPTEEVETKVANITGAKSVDKSTAKVGETLKYTITLTNNGNADGTVTVTDEIPTGTRIKDENTTGYNKATNTMIWSDVEVKAGKSAKLALEVVVEDNISIIKNIAYVDGNKIPEEPETTVKHHYTVEHYTENLDGTYSKVDKDTVVSEDVEIGTKVSYEVKKYEGFEYDESQTVNKDATVPDNNNLVVKLYYTRNSYKVTYEYEGTVPAGASNLPEEATYKYGANVTVAEEATAPGYTFSGWDKEDFTMPAEDVVIKGSFTANTDTQYKVEHYLQDLDGNSYTLKDTVTLAGTTDTTATATPKQYPGFTFDSTVVGTKTEGIVTGDGQLVLKLYYVRATYTYTIHYFYNGVEDEGKQEGPFQGKFGEKIDAYTEKNEEGKYTKYDVTSSNKTAEAILTIGTGVNFINVYYGTPQISINKAVSTSTANVGEGLHYTITVEETRGLVDATGVNVTDKIPEGLENITTNNGTINGENVEWNNLTIAKGSSVTLEFDATVKANMIGKTISNTATLGGSESGNSNTVITNVNEIQALTHELTPGQTGKDAANIVLVMDLSSSMNEKIKKFTTCTHEREKRQHWDPWNGEWTEEYCPEGCKEQDDGTWGKWEDTSTTRLAAAKEAAQNFVNNVYAKTNASDPDSKATITVITFNQENGNSKYVGTKVLTFGTDNKNTATASNYNELVTEIGNINIGTQTSGLGTHIRAALDKAYDTIYGTENEVGIATTYPNNSNYVIFLGDGDPTTSYNNNNKDSIDTSAQEIKDAGATIYSIGFGEDISDKNSTGYKILESISSEKKVYTANDSVTLTEIFKNLAGGMNDKTSATEDGKIIVTPERTLYFNTADGKKEYITVQYNGTTLMECKSQEELNTNEYLTYSEGKLSFDVNKWNSVESNTKIITGGENLVLKYYIERAN